MRIIFLARTAVHSLITDNAPHSAGHPTLLTDN